MFILTLTVGCLVVMAISLSPLYGSRLPLLRSAPLGTGLILAAVGLAAAGAALPAGLPPFGHALFLCVFLMLFLGSLLLLGDDPDDRPEDGGDEPPWWPEFEASFRRYERRRRPLPVR